MYSLNLFSLPPESRRHYPGGTRPFTPGTNLFTQPPRGGRPGSCSIPQGLDNRNGPTQPPACLLRPEAYIRESRSTLRRLRSGTRTCDSDLRLGSGIQRHPSPPPGSGLHLYSHVAPTASLPPGGGPAAGREKEEQGEAGEEGGRGGGAVLGGRRPGQQGRFGPGRAGPGELLCAACRGSGWGDG